MWDEETEQYANWIINAAIERDIPLEINESSKREKYHYWPEFWELAERKGVRIIHGLELTVSLNLNCYSESLGTGKICNLSWGKILICKSCSGEHIIDSQK